MNCRNELFIIAILLSLMGFVYASDLNDTVQTLSNTTNQSNIFDNLYVNQIYKNDTTINNTIDVYTNLLRVYNITDSTRILIRTDKEDGIAALRYQNDAHIYSTRINGQDEFQIRDVTADVARLTLTSDGQFDFNDNNIINAPNVPLKTTYNYFTDRQVINISDNAIRAYGNNASFEILNSLGTANWYFGIDEVSSSACLGVGYSASQSIKCSLKILNYPGGIDIPQSLSATGMSASAQSNALCYNSETGLITFNSGITTCLESTEKVKTNVSNINYSFENKLMQLNPISYNEISTGKYRIGLLAEDVETVFPELIGHDKNGNITGIEYQLLSIYLLNEYKNQTTELNKMKSDIEYLKSKIK